MILDREETKRRYEAYRNRARDKFEDVGLVDSGHIHVPTEANVQMTTTGAFVEALLWIPLEEIT